MSVGVKAPRTRRRRAEPGIDVEQALLDAAEGLMRDEGYAAATARRIAARVGLKHQVIFYYFGSQDELLRALFRRVADAHRRRMAEALACDQPLRALWRLMCDPSSTKLTLEFLALANHNEAVRSAIAESAESVRAFQAQALARQLEALGSTPELSPRLMTVLASALGRLLVQDANIGVVSDREEIEALIEATLQRLEAPTDVPQTD